MLILVCGLSKCGKTSLIEAALRRGLDVPVVKASDLLKLSGRPTHALTAWEALANQRELIRLLTEHVRAEEPTILDGHLLIETADGPQLVPDTVLKLAGLVGVIAVTAAPKAVTARRLGTPFTPDLQEIEELMLIETAQARRLARSIRIPSFEINHLDVSAFTESVSECLKKSGAAPR